MAREGTNSADSKIAEVICNLPETVFLVSESGEILATSQVAEKTFGYTKSQLLGSQLSDLFASESQHLVPVAIERAKSNPNGEPTQGNLALEAIGRSGNKFQVAWSASHAVTTDDSSIWVSVRNLDQLTVPERARREMISALDERAHKVISGFNLREELEQLAENLVDTIPHDKCTVILRTEENDNSVEAAFSCGEIDDGLETGMVFPFANSIVEWITNTGIAISFTSENISNAPRQIKTAAANGIVESFAVPLFHRQNLIGALVIGTKNPSRFTNFQKQLIERLANHVGIAIANHQLLSGAEENSRISRVMNEISHKLMTSDSFDTAFEGVREEIQSLLDYDRLTIHHVDVERRTLTGLFEDGESLPDFNHQQTRQLDEGTFSVLAGAFERGQIITFDQEMIVKTAAQQPVMSTLRDMGYKRAIIAPLMVMQNPVGFLIAGRKSDVQFSVRETATFSRLAEQMQGPLIWYLEAQEKKQAAREEAQLAELTETISQLSDLQSGAPIIGPMLRELIHSNSLIFSSLTRDKNNLRIDYIDSDEDSANLEVEAGDVRPWKGTTAEEAFITGRPVIVNLPSGEDFANKFPGSSAESTRRNVRSVLNIPLFSNQEIFGFLTLRSSQLNAYTQADVDIARRVAAQLGSSIAMAELRLRESDLDFEQETLNLIGEVMGSATDLDDAWDDFAEQVKKLIPADALTVVETDSSKQTSSLLYISTDSVSHAQTRERGEKFPSEGTIAERLIAERKASIYEFSDPDDRRVQFPHSLREDSTLPYRTIMGAPIIWNNEVVATVFIFSESEHAYAPTQLRLLERIAAQISGPIGGAQVRSLEAKIAREDHILAELANFMNRQSTAEEAFGGIHPYFEELFNADAFALITVDNDAGMARHRNAWIRDDRRHNYDGSDTEFPLTGTMVEQVVSTGHGIKYNYGDAEQLKSDYPGSPSAALQTEGRRMILVPVRWSKDVVAVLWISEVGGLEYTNEDLALAERVAARMSGPVAGRMQVEAEQKEAHERNVVARVTQAIAIDDDIGHALPVVAGELQDLIEFDALSIIRVNRATDTVDRLCFWHNENWNDEFRQSASNISPTGRTIVGSAIQERKTIVYTYENSDQLFKDFPDTPSQHRDIPGRTTIVCPLVEGGQLVAVLWASRIGSEKFTTSETAALERIARGLSGPVAGYILRVQQELVASEERQLESIGRLLSSGKEISNVWDHFVREVSELLRFDAVEFIQFDHDARTAHRPMMWFRPEIAHSFENFTNRFDLEGTMSEEVINTGETVVSNFGDFETLDYRYPGSPKLDSIPEKRSSILVPLRWSEQIYAGLWFCTQGSGDYTEQEIEMSERIALRVAGPIAGSILRTREMELQSEQLKREVAEQQAEAFRKLNETKNIFVSTMSHELKTPLTGIVSFADILSHNRSGNLEDRQIKHLQVIQRNARNLEAMINELLDLSRMESGDFVIVRSPFDFVSAVVTCIETHAPQMELKQQDIEFAFDNEVTIVDGDRQRLTQVINNLLSNASKYSPEGTKIEINVTQQHGWVTCTFLDQGHGLAGEDPNELLEMFRRGDNEHTRGVPGTGIGLHIAKRVIDDHGGEITLSDRPGGGMKVEFKIPAGI